MSAYKVYSFTVKPKSAENFAAIESLLGSPGNKEEVSTAVYLRNIGAVNVVCSDRVYKELKNLSFLKDLSGLEVEPIGPVQSKTHKGLRIP